MRWHRGCNFAYLSFNFFRHWLRQRLLRLWNFEFMLIHDLIEKCFNILFLILIFFYDLFLFNIIILWFIQIQCFLLYPDYLLFCSRTRFTRFIILVLITIASKEVISLCFLFLKGSLSDGFGLGLGRNIFNIIAQGLGLDLFLNLFFSPGSSFFSLMLSFQSFLYSLLSGSDLFFSCGRSG